MRRRIGIVAGAGRFVAPALSELRRNGLAAIVLGIRGEAASGLSECSDSLAWIKPGELGKAVHFFRSHEVGEILLLGKIRPEVIFRRQDFDRKTWRLLSELKEKNAGTVVGTAIAHLEANGLRVLNPRAVLKSCFCEDGALTRKGPTLAQLRDVDLGLRMARRMADAEIGQAVVVKNQTVVAVEGLEGTDQMIRRAGRLAGPGFAAAKAGRSRQDMRIDLPAVGLDTVRTVIQAGGSALGLEAFRVAFFQKEEAVALAEEKGLTLVARKL